MAESFSNGESAEVSHLEARYRHLDDRVGKLSQEVAGIGATLNQVSATLSAISQRVNQPQKVEWAAILGALSVAMSLGYATILPLKDRLDVHAGKLTDLQFAQIGTAKELGEIAAYRQAGENAHRHLTEDVTTIRRDVQSVIAADAATDAKVEALSERLRDVDMAGSRRWIKRGD